jgi:hypothetical protein
MVAAGQTQEQQIYAFIQAELVIRIADAHPCVFFKNNISSLSVYPGLFEFCFFLVLLCFAENF